MAYTPVTPTTLSVPDQTYSAAVVAARPQSIDRNSFSKALTGTIDPLFGSIIKTGSGQAVNQTGGNLVLTTGTTVNTETIIRSIKTYVGGVRLREQTTLSQRIANNSFYVELVDVIGDGLAMTISSATALTVTIPSSPFDGTSVGQSVFIGGYTGTGTFIPGRYTIASTSGTAVTFTVAGFVAGSGTGSLFGWNYYHMLYDGATATAAKFDTQRKGYNSGDSSINVNTTATPGHIGIITGNDAQSLVSDQLVASLTTPRSTVRGSRDANVPDDIPLYVQIRAVNGTTAPATTTTWTIGFVTISNYAAQDVVVQDTRQTTNNTPIPMDLQRSSVTLATSATSTPATGTPYTLTTAATTNAAVIKASGGNFFDVSVSNVTATAIYVKLYNLAVAPTVGTSVPLFVLQVAANTTVTYEFGPIGKRFSTGIAVATTGASATTDTSVAVAGAIISATYM